MLFATKVPRLVPTPPAVVPVPPPGLPKEGGGATTVCGPSIGAADARDPEPLETPAAGGAITFAVNDVPVPLRAPPGVPAATATEGGGATTLGASEGAEPRFAPVGSTDGGG